MAREISLGSKWNYGKNEVYRNVDYLWRKESLIPGRRVKLFQNLQAFQLEGIVEVGKEEIGEKLVKLFHLLS